MLFALVLSGFLVLFYIFVLSARNKYFFISPNQNGKIKKRIIRLPTKYITHFELLNEIEYFNSLWLVADSQNGVAAEYIRQVNCLLSNPKYRPNNDPYEKLFYAYACFVLMQKTGHGAEGKRDGGHGGGERRGKNEHGAMEQCGAGIPGAGVWCGTGAGISAGGGFFVWRQLRNNLRWVFAPQIKIVRRINPLLIYKKYTAYPPVRYKIFNNSFVDLRAADFKTEMPTAVTVCDSFVVYKNASIEIRRFDGVYDIYTQDSQTVSFIIAPDKTDFDCSISRGVVTAKNLTNGEVKRYKVTGEHIRLSTSIADKTDALELYVTAAGAASVSVIDPHTRTAAAHRTVRRALSPAEIEYNRRVESIVSAAHNSRFVAGENLRERYFAAEKEIPSLRLMTVVYEIIDADIVLSVLDNLEYYKKAAKLFGGFNIVFLYSGGSDFVSKLVAGFIMRDDIAKLTQSSVFMYFIDRVAASVDTIYYLCRMMAAGKTNFSAGGNEITVSSDRVTVNELREKTYPYTKTVVLQNADRKQQSVTVFVPITFGGLSAVSANGRTVTVTGLFSGRTDTYKLPPDAFVTIKNEMITDRIEIKIKTKLLGFEQRKFQIVKNEGVLSPKERKNQFIISLENVCVRSGDPQFNKIFSLAAAENETPHLLSAVKGAVKNADRHLFLSLLSNRRELGSDLWAYLLNKVIGVRLIKNTVQIVPNINITGDFSLSFDYCGKTHNFNIVQKKGGCCIDYGGGINNNFLQINMKNSDK